ncbi:right-handed parallel beta-helix repeat-containing protein [Candidatus Saccharibacteria bacterium]|nr:MAG: right-handed parallel beta-helix repeat-containing protein [Candidatus Saccharibacteria bacterium]
MMTYDTTNKQLLTYANGKWQADRSDAVLVAASNSSEADKAAADYVATGSGDQTTIQSALDSADPSAGTRKSGKVLLFAGTYTVTDTINIPDNTTLTGAGRGSLIQFGNIAGQNKNMIQNKNTTASTGLVLRDIRLDGNKATNTTGTQHGVYLLSSTFPGSGAGARIGSVVQNVWVSNFRSNGIYVHNQSGNSNISNNMVQDNAAIGIAVQSAHANNVTNNYVVGNATDGIWVSGSSYNVISMNNVNSNTNRGIVVDGSANSNTINSNALKDNGTGTEASILVLNAATTLISNNAITDNTGASAYAIDIDPTATNVYIANNSLVGTAVTNGVRDQGTNTTIGGQLNNVMGTGSYVIQNAGGVSISSSNKAVSSAVSIQSGNSTAGTAATVSIDTGTSTGVVQAI